MTDKQMEEKKEEFEHLSSLIRLQRKNLGESQDVYGKRFNVGGNAVSEWETAHSIPKYPILSKILWQWIEKLVEEVERETKEIDRKLMEKVADSDYQFGFIRGTQTSESLTPLQISEHEEERKKIRKEMMERFYN